jgi:tRNA(Arg) A34 adenosine deaminase TadA
MTGPCAKRLVTALLVAEDFECFVGANWVKNAQPTCPRLKGEGYEKCKTICGQEGHAEIMALKDAGEKARGCRMYVNHKPCSECQAAMDAAGVIGVHIVGER